MASLNYEGKYDSLELLNLLKFVDQSAGEDGVDWGWGMAFCTEFCMVLCTFHGRLHKTLQRTAAVRLRLRERWLGILEKCWNSRPSRMERPHEASKKFS